LFWLIDEEDSMAVGSFCLVLHGHMPYVLRHGAWPHGEDWLYEAAAETYLPLLKVIDECQALKGNPRVTLGLTPVLLEQLAHNDFKRGFQAYLNERAERARSDREDFQRQGQLHQVYLATLWEKLYDDLSAQFTALHRDIPRAFAEQAAAGSVQLLTSNATHAYTPLLLEDSSIRAQLRAGLDSSRRILGLSPKGLWLPECAYRPAGTWTPPISWGGPRYRGGIDEALSAEGLTHFFTESHQIRSGLRPGAGTHEPAWVCHNGDGRTNIAALTRDPDICQQVWSGFVGYPADGMYLEFHKRQGERRGLRYWKVTNPRSDLGAKDPYYPDDVSGKIYEHAQHFCGQVRHRLWDHHHRTGRYVVVVACFDAELFGHWWFEGPRFLRDVLLTLNADPDVDLCTAEEVLHRHPPEQGVWLSEGSWGEGGGHRVWTNEKVNWMWDVEYRRESLFGKLTYHLPWRQNAALASLLKDAGRELLLLQASDWPFVISRGQAMDYGIKRFMQHVSRFDVLTDLAERFMEDPACLRKLSEVTSFEIKDAQVHDVIFPEIDLNWWNV
jgi:1,4-alpha-glucan branching enzyme